MGGQEDKKRSRGEARSQEDQMRRKEEDEKRDERTRLRIEQNETIGVGVRGGAEEGLEEEEGMAREERGTTTAASCEQSVWTITRRIKWAADKRKVIFILGRYPRKSKFSQEAG